MPFNWAGESSAHSGKGYAGIYVWDANHKFPNTENTCRVNCQNQLKAGEKYVVEFYFTSWPQTQCMPSTASAYHLLKRIY